MISCLDLVRDEIKHARENFTAVVANVTQEMLQVDPGAKAFPLGATWAHAICTEDNIIHNMLKREPALYETTFKDASGLSMPMPPMDDRWSETNELWSRSVTVDLPKFLEYQEAVFAATDKYIMNLHDDEFDAELDLGTWGKKRVWYILYEMVAMHMSTSTGEISVLKGLQGVRGLA